MTDDERGMMRGLFGIALEEEPPGLVRPAEIAAAGRRRRLVGAGAGIATACSVTALVLVAAAALPTGSPSTVPAATGAASATPGNPCVYPPLGSAQPLGDSAEAAAAWGYRGDPAVRATAERVPRLHNEADGVVLYAARTGPGDHLLVVYAAKVVDTWDVFAVWAPRGVGPASVWVQDSAIARLPLLRPDAAISLLLPTPQPSGEYTNTVVVLAPPGAAGISYRGCWKENPFEVTADGDVLVQDVGPLDNQGRLVVTAAGGGPGYSGPAADLPAFGDRPDVHPIR